MDKAKAEELAKKNAILAKLKGELKNM